MTNKETIKENVRQLLREYSDTRDDDKILIWRYWKYIDHATSMLGQDIICYHHFKDATSPMAINRCRRHIQNVEKQYLPTTLEIARKRKISEKDWREYMGDSATGQMSLGMGNHGL